MKSHLVENVVNPTLDISPSFSHWILKVLACRAGSKGLTCVFTIPLTTGILECTRYYLCTRNSIQCNITTLHSLRVSICIVLNSSRDKKTNVTFITISCAYFSVDVVVAVFTLLHHISSLVPLLVYVFSIKYKVKIAS